MHGVAVVTHGGKAICNLIFRFDDEDSITGERPDAGKQQQALTQTTQQAPAPPAATQPPAAQPAQAPAEPAVEAPVEPTRQA